MFVEVNVEVIVFDGWVMRCESTSSDRRSLFTRSKECTRCVRVVTAESEECCLYGSIK